MKAFYWIIASSVLLVCLAVVLLLGGAIDGKSMALIKLSHFQSAEQVADSIFLCMHEDLRQAPALLVGIEPDHEFHKNVVLKMLQQMNEGSKNLPSGELKYFVVADSKLQLAPELAALVQQTVDSTDLEALASGTKVLLARGEKVLILVPSIFSTHKIDHNPATRMEHEFNLPVTSLTFSTFPIERNQENNMTTPCITGERDLNGVGPLGCLIVQKARQFYRKKLSAQENWGSLELVGTRDYLFLLN